MSRGIFVDANLPVLLVIGGIDARLIGKHRPLRTFDLYLAATDKDPYSAVNYWHVHNV